MEDLIKKHSDKIRFLLVGGTNTAIDMSFYANKTFTFKDNNKNLKTKMVTFLAITLFGLWVVQPVIITIAKSIFDPILTDTNIILLIGKFAATCVTLVWNYLMYRKFVFVKTKNQELI